MPEQPKPQPQEAKYDARESEAVLAEKVESTAEAPESKVRAEIARRWNNVKSTVDQLTTIARDIASEQLTKLGLNKKDAAALPETQAFEKDLAALEQQKNTELAAAEAEFIKRYGGWGTLEDGLRFLKPEEVTPQERETIAHQVVGKLLEGDEAKILYHATGKKRFDVGAPVLDTSRDFSLQAVNPLERYFSSSAGDVAEQPIAMRVIGKDPKLLQNRTGTYGEYGIDKYKRLIRLPVKPEKRQSQTGVEYEVHTYALEDEIKQLGPEYVAHVRESKQDYSMPDLYKKDEDVVREYAASVKDPGRADEILSRIQR